MRISDWSSDVCSSDLLQAVSRRRDDAELAGQNLVENLRALSQAGRKRIFFQDLLGSCRLANLGKGQSDNSSQHPLGCIASDGTEKTGSLDHDDFLTPVSTLPTNGAAPPKLTHHFI